MRHVPGTQSRHRIGHDLHRRRDRAGGCRAQAAAFGQAGPDQDHGMIGHLHPPRQNSLGREAALRPDRRPGGRKAQRPAFGGQAWPRRKAQPIGTGQGQAPIGPCGHRDGQTGIGHPRHADPDRHPAHCGICIPHQHHGRPFGLGKAGAGQISPRRRPQRHIPRHGQTRGRQAPGPPIRQQEPQHCGHLLQRPCQIVAGLAVAIARK